MSRIAIVLLITSPYTPRKIFWFKIDRHRTTNNPEILFVAFSKKSSKKFLNPINNRRCIDYIKKNFGI